MKKHPTGNLSRQNTIVFFSILVMLLPAFSPARDNATHSGLIPKQSSADNLVPSGKDSNIEMPKPNTSSSSKTLCETGKQQSPVDIRVGQFADLPPVSFRYRSSLLSMLHDGHTIRSEYEPGSYLRFGGSRFDLQGFELYSPSEHAFAGQKTDAAIHLRHVDSAGNRLIVAIPIYAGRRHNSMFSRIVSHLPVHAGHRNHQRQVGINVTFLLPSDRSYYTYPGSLTSAPCTEGVRWLVFRSPLEIDASQIGRLRSIIGNNARPIQSLNDRKILKSMH